MQSYDLKNLPFIVNFLVIFYLIFHITFSWLISGTHQDTRSLSVWLLLNSSVYFINYFFVTERVFKTGFSSKKFLVFGATFIACYLILSYGLNTWSYTWMINKGQIEFGFTQYVTRLQTGFFYLLFSTGVRVIKMLETNQFTIQDLEVERKKIELENLQTSIGSDLVFDYIFYLQEKNKKTSVSNEIVELADFLRYTTYRSDEKQAPFSTELGELERFREVLYKSKGPKLNIRNDLNSNPLIPVFSLLTPLKELLVKVTDFKEIDVLISGVGTQVKMIIKLKCAIRDDLNFEFSKLNKDLNQLEVDII